MDNIDKYYLLHRLTGGSIEIVASLIELIANQPKKPTIKNLEDLRLKNYDVALEKLMDLKVTTIKDIANVINGTPEKRTKRQVIVSNPTNAPVQVFFNSKNKEGLNPKDFDKNKFILINVVTKK